MIFNGKKLLLAEDEDALVEALTNWFNFKPDFQGIKLFFSKNAIDTEAILLNEQPEFTLLDLGLGDGTDGLDLLKKLKGNLPKKCKIFIFSGYSEYKQQCLDEGAIEFIPKKVTMKELTEILKKHAQ